MGNAALVLAGSLPAGMRQAAINAGVAVPLALSPDDANALSWPAWQHDQNLAALYAPKISAAFMNGMAAAEAFLAQVTSGEVRVTPTYAAQEVSRLLAASLRSAMVPLWTEGYALGAISARHAVMSLPAAPALATSAGGTVIKVGPKGYVHGWIKVEPGETADDAHIAPVSGVIVNFKQPPKEIFPSELEIGDNVFHRPTFAIVAKTSRNADNSVGITHLVDGAHETAFSDGEAADLIARHYNIANGAVPTAGEYNIARHFSDSTAVSSEERKSISRYQGGNYYSINSALRSAEDGKRQAALTSADVKNLDAVASRYTTADDAVVYRGGLVHDGNVKPGDEYTDHGFGSTSFDRRIAEQMQRGSGTVTRIHLPVGSHGISTLAAADDRDEHEFILPRDTAYRVDSVDDDGIINVSVITGKSPKTGMIAGVMAAATLTKIGKEGYIHGWICERPPCGKVGDRVSHPDHGDGLITDEKLHTEFDDGTTGTLGKPAGATVTTDLSTLGDVHPLLRKVLDRRLESFASRYPHAASKLTAIRMAQPGEMMSSHTMAQVEYISNGNSFMKLNPDYFTDFHALQGAQLKASASGFHPLDTMGSVIDHELGHVVDFSHDEDDNLASNDVTWRSPFNNMMISKYARKNQQEAFAEAFAIWEDAESGNPTTPDFTLRKLTPEMTASLKNLRSWDALHHTAASVTKADGYGPADLSKPTCEGYFPPEDELAAPDDIAKLAGDPYPTPVTGPDWHGWQPGDLDAAAKVASGDRLTQLLQQWGVNVISSVSQTKLGDLAQLIASALADGKSSGQLAQDITGLLNVPSRAKMIAQTEIARASSAATLDTYLDMGVSTKQWITAPDEGTCFPAGTSVLTPKSDVSIDELRVGDRVITPQGTQVVTATSAREYIGGITAVEAGEQLIVATDNHPFMTDFGWRDAVRINVGDFLQTSQNERVQVISVIHFMFAKPDDMPAEFGEVSVFPAVSAFAARNIVSRKSNPTVATSTRYNSTGIHHRATAVTRAESSLRLEGTWQLKDFAALVTRIRKQDANPSREWRIISSMPLLVYNITVDVEHVFYANNFLVHNCKICRACEAEGAIPLSQAFLIGVDAAPAHPNCRCSLLPASVDDFDLSDMTVEPLPGFNLVPFGGQRLNKVGPEGYIHGWIRVDPGDLETHSRQLTNHGYLQPEVTGERLKSLTAEARATSRRLTPAQQKAVTQWASGKGMVRRIQSGSVSAATLSSFSQAMSQLPKVDGFVYRGVKPGSLGAKSAEALKPGDSVNLREPVSASVDPRQSAGFGTYVYEIHAPGAAAYIAPMSKFAYEKEAVLAPGEYAVTSVEDSKIALGSVTSPVRVIHLEGAAPAGGYSWAPARGGS